MRDHEAQTQPGASVVDLTLGRRGRVAGLVYDPIGNTAFDGVELRLVASDGRVQAVTHSDAAGAYAFANVPIGEYQLLLSPPSGFLGPPGVTRVAVQPGRESTLDVPLAKGGRLRGRVLDDATGQPLGRVLLGVYDAHGHRVRTGTSTSGGEYEFVNLPPGEYDVRVEPDN